MQDVISQIGQDTVTDICLPGWLVDSPIKKFDPWTWTSYLELASGRFVRLHAVNYSGQVEVTIVDEIHEPPEWEGEEETLVVASLNHLFLMQESYRVTAIRWVTDEGSDPVRGVVKCIEFIFEGAQSLFVDPEWYFGLHLSGAGAYEKWILDRDETNWQEHLSKL